MADRVKQRFTDWDIPAIKDQTRCELYGFAKAKICTLLETAFDEGSQLEAYRRLAEDVAEAITRAAMGRIDFFLEAVGHKPSELSESSE